MSRGRGAAPALRGLLVVALALLAPLAASARSAPVFDGAAAYRLVEKQCAFGPRNPGSGGHAACLAFLTTEFQRLAGAVERQDFSYTLPGASAPLRMTNLIARFGPPDGEKILLCAHWDTRPWADRDPDPNRREEPILGANDGASGVAVLLELARHLKSHPPSYRVEIALFDGEDLGTVSDPDGFFRGSKHYAGRYRGTRPIHGILLDMVGDRDLQFRKEGYSIARAPATLNWLWSAGESVAPDYFLPGRGYWVLDDHIPLLGVGIPCVDLIDFDYPAWHTAADRPDQVSPTSLQVVGDVLIHLLYPEARGDAAPGR